MIQEVLNDMGVQAAAGVGGDHDHEGYVHILQSCEKPDSRSLLLGKAKG